MNVSNILSVPGQLSNFFKSNKAKAVVGGALVGIVAYKIFKAWADAPGNSQNEVSADPLTQSQNEPSLSNRYLARLEFSYQDLTQLNLRDYPNSKDVFLHSNLNLARVDLSHNGLLETLIIYSSRIEKLDLSCNRQLRELFLSSNNQLTELDLRSNRNLQTLNINNNRFTQLDLTNNQKLQTLNINNNRFTQLDLTNNVDLTSLNLSCNRFIEGPGLTQNRKLRRVDLSHNQLTNIPAHYASLPKTCEIILEGNRLSPEAIEEFRRLVKEQRRRDPNLGPNVCFSIYGVHLALKAAASLEQEKAAASLRQEIEIWGTGCNEFLYIDSPSFFRMNSEEQTVLEQYLKKLRESENYIQGGITRSKLCEKLKFFLNSKFINPEYTRRAISEMKKSLS